MSITFQQLLLFKVYELVREHYPKWKYSLSELSVMLEQKLAEVHKVANCEDDMPQAREIYDHLLDIRPKAALDSDIEWLVKDSVKRRILFKNYSPNRSAKPIDETQMMTALGKALLEGVTTNEDK